MLEAESCFHYEVLKRLLFPVIFTDKNRHCSKKTVEVNLVFYSALPFVMKNGRFAVVEISVAVAQDSKTEIDVFSVHKIAFVESAYFFINRLFNQ